MEEAAVGSETGAGGKEVVIWKGEKEDGEGGWFRGKA